LRVLLVTPFYAPDLGPSAPLLTMLCEDLARLGHQVSVIAAVPHYPSGIVPAGFRGRLIQREQRNGVEVIRVWVPSGDRSNLRHRLLTFLMFQVLSSIVGLRCSYDVLMITNPAIETYLPFTLLSWLRRKASLLCVWDVYPEIGIRMGIFRNPLITSVVGTLEDFCLRHARVIQVLGDGFISSLKSHAVPTSKIVVIPPWLDTDFIRPLPRRNSFSIEQGLNENFVVLYAGNLGFSQGLENVLLAAKMLSHLYHIRFVFIGDGANRERLVTQTSELGLQNVKFIPLQPRERLPEVLATSDISLVSLQGGVGDSSLPSKTFPILASGRPVLAVADKGSGLWNLVQQSRGGVCVLPSDPRSLAENTLVLEKSPELRQQMAKNAREFALQFHSRKSVAQQFETILQTLAS
jgi:colanic acid biosynthesis glycosyl transferase WcaI